MGRKLAIDFGLKRTGLAITDTSNIIASPLETVNSGDLMARLKVLVEQNQLDTFVLGLPKNLDNTDTDITQNVYFLKEALDKQFPSVETVLLDERFTSKMAFSAMIAGGLSKKQRADKATIDKVSAAILLQNYLDARF
ncbi:MAG: Holliday junction resolvase RuvX [Bacteroidota bacterium]